MTTPEVPPEDRRATAPPHPAPRPIATACLLVTLALATPLATALAALATALATPLARLRRRPETGAVSHVIVRAWARLLVASARVPVRLAGIEHLPSGPAVFICNHQSAADSFLIAALIRRDMRFIARHDLFRVLWIMRLARYIPVDRERRRDWRRIAQRARQHLAHGASITLFPEGRRSRSGRLQRFHGGAFRIALDNGVPIVPLLIEGTGAVMPPERFMLHAGETRLTVLPPIDPASFTGRDRRDLARAVHALYTAELERAAQCRAPLGSPLTSPIDAPDAARAPAVGLR